MNAIAWRWAIASPKAGARLRVVERVLVRRARDADGQRRRAPRRDAFRSGSTSQPASPPSRCAGGHAAALELDARRAGARAGPCSARAPSRPQARRCPSAPGRPGCAPSSAAYTSIHSASAAYGTLHFTPSSTYVAVRARACVAQRARVEVEARLLPGGGARRVGVTGRRPAGAPPSARSVPPSSTGSATRAGASSASAPATSPQASSSQKSAPVTTERCPKPPCASGRLAGRSASSQPACVQRGAGSPLSSAARDAGTQLARGEAPHRLDQRLLVVGRLEPEHARPRS